MTTPMTKAEVLAVLREVLLSPNSIHHPFAHDYIKDEKGCDKCKRYKRFEQAMGAIAAWNVSPDGGVDWRGMYRFQTAMRYMDNRASLTKEDAYRMADEDVASLERAQLAQQGGESDE